MNPTTKTITNVGLQLLATGFIAGGANKIATSNGDLNDYITGGLLFVMGIITYYMYEKFPDSPK